MIDAKLGERELATPTSAEMVSRLRAVAIRGLARMYRADERLFVFRLRKAGNGLVAQGLSRRYTAIAIIGLAQEEEAVASFVLGGHGSHDVCGRLLADVVRTDNLGDVALTLWAACAAGYPDRRWAWERLLELRPAAETYPVVEVAWTLSALCVERDAPLDDLRDQLAHRLAAAFDFHSGIFAHTVGKQRVGLRSHVSCFADLVYPIHALTHYFRRSGHRESLDLAVRCAGQLRRLQGKAGQWWWHYDRRTGNVIERYPVYAVHQDAMAPMALHGLEDVTGSDYSPQVEKGLAWLMRAPELGGGSLIDPAADLIWRKVARHEPGKFSRYIQATASRVHPRLRAPGLRVVCPPGAIDYEDRPYHLGWLLYAWPGLRLARAEKEGE
jgi:hypothetical protein